MKDFEVLMVSVNWEKSNVHSNIVKSARSLKPLITKEKKYEYDIVMYTKEEGKYFQFCIKTEYTPYVLVEGKSVKLFNISKNLWIIKEEWKTGQRGIGYHYCPSINTLGTINILISKDKKKIHHQLTINVNPSIEGFDFEKLKDDFEGELWNLITSNKSKVVTDKSELRYGDKIFRYPESKQIIDFIGMYDKISKKPKIELLHSKANVKIAKVRPIAETYRKLVMVGRHATHLPSKIVTKNMDIYENRYVCFMLWHIHRIVFNNVHFTPKQVGKIISNIESKGEIIKGLQKDYIEVNPKILEAEISSQKEDLEHWKQRWEKNKEFFLRGYKSSKENLFTFHFTVKNVSTSQGNKTLWGNLFTSDNKIVWAALEFDGNVGEVFENGKEITVQFDGSYARTEFTTKAKKKYFIYSIQTIRPGSFKYVSSNKEKIIQKQETNYKNFKSADWRRPLTTQDKKEQKNQVQTLTKRIVKLQAQLQNLSDYIEEQKKLLPFLETRLKRSFFKNVRRRRSKRFTPSMTFIQNINYRKTLGFYNDILKSEGIDLEVFDLYEKSINYGLREMPQVYELWCLVSIIRTLEEGYNFKHNSKGIHSLLKVINPQSKNIDKYVSINFSEGLKNRQVILHYQITLKTGKRPDIILEISSDKNRVNLILDAKFKNYNYKKSLTYEIENLLDKYQQGNNCVFALHPCNNLKHEEHIVKMTNHGGDRIYFGEEENKTIQFPFHKYGFISMKPNYSDNLKKLLGMSFEYLLEKNKNARGGRIKDPKPNNELFCLNCGGEDISLSRIERGNGRCHYKTSCNSSDCGHESYIDYCWNCFTKLFKHGFYWDYHKTSVWSSFDIHCPKCNMTVADMPKR